MSWTQATRNCSYNISMSVGGPITTLELLVRQITFFTYQAYTVKLNVHVLGRPKI